VSGTYLDAIVRHHRERAASDSRSTSDLAAVADRMPPARGFANAIRHSSVSYLAVISEIKRRSPSKGALNIDLDPALLAAQYELAGASCISVLTDEPHFGGSASDLRTARAACSIPILRKDFTVAEVDVFDARIMGADCVLLIVAALGRDELEHLYGLARAAGLDVLVEVHDESELEVALDIGSEMIGVNQRDLFTFEVDTERAVRVGASMPDGVVKVAESGIRDAADARIMLEAGFDAILVGETLVRSSDPVAELRSLLIPRTQ
jgi:indole-3-glycerol phosphate synthase